VKTPQELLEVYYRSVGRNCVLLLNVPPDQRGLFHENDVAVLREFRRILDETFAVNLAASKPVEASTHREGHAYFSPSNVVDDDLESYWAADDGVYQATLEVDLGDAVYFDRVMIQEPILFGQRISAFALEIRANGQWATVARGTTVGYKRLLRIEGVEADRVRIIIEQANNVPALSNLGLFRASAGEAVRE
jgi:alpha-L-fucosidase